MREGEQGGRKKVRKWKRKGDVLKKGRENREELGKR